MPGSAPPLGPVAQIRRWEPTSAGVADAICFVDRHPEFYPDAEEVPVREVKRLSRSVKRGWRGVFQSLKMNRSMRHLNAVELGVLRICEADPAVTNFVEHPTRLRVVTEQGFRYFAPSTFVHRGGEPWFIACRRSETASNREALWEELGSKLASAGYGFEVITELHVQRQPQADNVATLLRGRWAEPPSEETIARAVERAASSDASLGDLCEAFGLVEPQVVRLVLNGVLHADLRRVISAATLLSAAPLSGDSGLWGAA